MKKPLAILTSIIITTAMLLISGCSIRNLDAAWAKDNKIISNKLGVRYYKLPKDKAMSAMAVAFQRLDLIVENMDFKTGFLLATANAPKPLSDEEMQAVIDVEDSRARSHVLFFTWNFRDFKSKFNVTFLETDEGVQISLRGNLEFVGNRNQFIPVTEFPPKAVEIANIKIWDEFEKIAFIQGETLKQ
ncbi:MAG: hypothetical protein D4R45_05855 [Planctomycetaceae bacterium]|nr:MAG: hypothetical protein D4R45_05855 [Planctomycetaceae bacterium]